MSKVLQRLADIDNEAVDARARMLAPASSGVQDITAVAELQVQLQTLQERLDKAELARVKECHAAAVDHSDQLHRLHHKLAAAEMQARALL